MQNRLSYLQGKLDCEIDSFDLMQAIKNNEKIIIVDARSPDAFAKEHIPSAINLFWQKIDKDVAYKNIDINALYVIYCDGIGSHASTKCALKLAEARYYVKVLVGGLDWWKHADYQTEVG